MSGKGVCIELKELELWVGFFLFVCFLRDNEIKIFAFGFALLFSPAVPCKKV